VNALDYSPYTGDITVDLALNLASLVNQGMAGSVWHIANVTGSIGNGLLVGDANANVLIGGTGRNILIGGNGSDKLDASRATSDNILVGGTTDYDTNVAALDAVFAEWTRTDLNFKDRFSDLANGTNGQHATPLNRILVNGQWVLILLTNTTVHGDTAPDTLIGSNQTDPATGQRVHNWFFYDLDDTLINFLTSSDHKTKVK
jgi:Ca2+-binding RTX toxin-like protein